MRAFHFSAFALILATVCATAQAEPPYWREQRRDERSYRNDRNYSPEKTYRDNRYDDKRAVRDVVGEVEHNYRGHVVDVQPPAANEDAYRVRVLQEGGRVKTLRVPANRGHTNGREK